MRITHSEDEERRTKEIDLANTVLGKKAAGLELTPQLRNCGLSIRWKEISMSRSKANGQRDDFLTGKRLYRNLFFVLYV